MAQSRRVRWIKSLVACLCDGRDHHLLGLLGLQLLPNTKCSWWLPSTSHDSVRRLRRIPQYLLSHSGSDGTSYDFVIDPAKPEVIFKYKGKRHIWKTQTPDSGEEYTSLDADEISKLRLKN